MSASSTDQPRPAGVAVVTGAAAGMGAAVARLMSQAGWPLLLCDLDAEKLEAAATPLRAAGEVATLAGDISDPAFPDHLKAALGAGPVGALVHCAGLSPSMADPGRILQVNLAATLALVQAVRPALSQGGAAVVVASIAGYTLNAPELDVALDAITSPEGVSALLLHATTPQAAYSISKRGVQRLARREAGAFGRQGARIVSVSPGIIETAMGQAEMKAEPAMAHMLAATPISRMGRAEEVAAVAVFLTSPAASFVTGIDIPVDGGFVSILPPGGLQAQA